MFLKLKEFGGIRFLPEKSVSLSIVHVGPYLVAKTTVMVLYPRGYKTITVVLDKKKNGSLLMVPT
jgi:hypothetical protein